MMAFIHHVLSRPERATLSFALVAALALAMAYTAEYVFGLAPCILCLYQRVPYAVVVGLGILGALISRRSASMAGWVMGGISLSFLINSFIAFYHTGVERHWWRSLFEGCAVPEMEGSITDVLAKIEAAPVVRCDEIPWADPILGLSMANYNVVFCLAASLVAIYSARLIMRRASSQSR